MKSKTLINQYRAHSRQAAFHQSPAKYRLFGGAMGGGKSVGGCAEGFKQSWLYPGNRGVMIRRNLTTLRRTLLPTFFNTVPADLIEDYNQSKQSIKLINGSEILYIDADESKDPLFNKLKSLEIGWFYFEEASEISKGAFAAMVSRRRWKLPDGSYPPLVGWLTTNPEDCWLKDDFVDGLLPGTEYIPSLPGDNPHLPEGYLDDMSDVLGYAQQRRYIYGDWGHTDQPDQLINYQWLHDAQTTWDYIDLADVTPYLGCDVARFGDDSSIIAEMTGSILTNIKQFRGLRTDQFADEIHDRITKKEINPKNVGVDVVGLGAGTCDNLRKKKLRVRELNSSSKAPTYKKFNFANLRSYMWWLLREDLKDGNIAILLNDKELIQELIAVRYKIESGKIIVEAKKEVKKRLKRSPDKADAFVYANAVRHKWKVSTGFNYISIAQRRNR
jgi:phage terminase large subunit